MRSSESVQQWRWMLNVCQSCYYRHVLVVPTGSKMKTGCSAITRQTGQLCDYPKTDCASFISLHPMLQWDSRHREYYQLTQTAVHLAYTGLRPYLETRSDCVFMFGICCVIAVSLFLYYTELRETWSDCVFMFGICCVIAVSLFLYYTGLRETWSDCVFMLGMCCVIAVSLFLYYTGWWLYIGSLMNKGKSVACTLLQLFNKVSIIVQVPTAPVSGTSSSWAVERTIVVCVLEKLMFIRFLLLKIKRKRIRSRLLQ